MKNNYIRKQIRLIRKKDPSFHNNFEVFLYPSFWSVLFHRIAHRLYKNKHFFIARFISQFSRLVTSIDIHPGAVIGNNFFIDHGIGVVIGETCIIGNNVLIYQGVTLGGTGKETGKRHPTIGNNVLIGAGAKILGPIKIGDNSRIGAGSVVLNEVLPNSTVVGIPGKAVIREKSDISPADSMDLVKMPDPNQMEFCRIISRIEEIEKRIDK